MQTRPPTEDEIAFWREHDQYEQRLVILGGPEEGDDVLPCPTLVSGKHICRVAYQLDEIEMADLAQGGTLWLAVWGALPVHQVLVTGKSTGH